MSVLAHTLSEAERQLRAALGTFERLGEGGLCNDLSTVIDRVIDRMAEVAQERKAA